MTSNGLTFDMRGGRQQAKLDVARPLDGRVRALLVVDHGFAFGHEAPDYHPDERAKL